MRILRRIKSAVLSPNAPMFLYCLITALGVAAPMAFLTTYVTKIGMDTAQLSYITAIRPIAMILGQYIWGIVADRSKTINRVLALLMSGVVASAVIFMFMQTFWGVMIATVVYYFFYSAIYPLMDTISMNMVASGQIRSYGDIRVMTSLGYVISVWGSGVLSEINPVLIFVVMGVCTLLATITMIWIPKAAGQRKKGEKFNSFKFFINPLVLFPLLAYLILQLVYASFDAVFPIYLSIDLGGGDSLYGLSMAIRVSGEFFVLPFLNKIQKVLPFKVACAVFFMLSVSRFIISAFTTNVVVLSVVSLLTGIGNIGNFTWIINYCGKLAPEKGKATVQSHMWMLYSVAQVFGSLSIRYFAPTVGSSLYFWVCAACMAVAAAMALLSKVDKDASRF